MHILQTTRVSVVLETNLKPSFVQALLLSKPIFILGDLNCNVMKDCPENTALRTFNQLTITPTRITDTSESLIDVIITSASHLVNESGVMDTIISDHLLVYAVLNMKLPIATTSIYPNAKLQGL
ncbi:Hypothetical predicted protein [Paramuricea clavata]|uniref:Uncharacterized protein n=1 Tax=Paramuricea clavata TaxID=317549 RepID=A0A7D9I8D2_PARCT|nr:Hypothetical predicted protein [Paramuricea clavata]